jgi:hypothetical protein
MGEIVSDLEGDGRELDAPKIADDRRKLARPAAGLAGEDRLQCLSLLFIGALVNEQADGGLCAGPDITFEGAERQQIEAIKLDIAETALADIPGEEPLTLIVGRRLRELAGTRNAAAANVEPIAHQVPLRNGVHCVLPRNRR